LSIEPKKIVLSDNGKPFHYGERYVNRILLSVADSSIVLI
jgi:hypothetical protein